ncbi:MAG: hypothetical protein HC842_06420, partial [Cytophagales bacterium]|nr:hypothetical protein [Cytophagales bacterium]
MDNEGGIGYYENLTVGQPKADSLKVDIQVTHASYYTATDGLIIFDSTSITGGIPPYKFRWNDNPTDTLRVFQFNLAAGFQKLTIWDSGDTTRYPWRNTTNYLIEVKQPEFVCGQDSIIDTDGIRYATVDINGQCWIQANLRTSKYTDGSIIKGRICRGNNCQDLNGAYYTYAAVLNGQKPGD